jgi:hypothetical protein
MSKPAKESEERRNWDLSIYQSVTGGMRIERALVPASLERIRRYNNRDVGEVGRVFRNKPHTPGWMKP